MKKLSLRWRLTIMSAALMMISCLLFEHAYKPLRNNAD